MAQGSISRAFFFVQVLIFALAAASVSAQEGSPSSAPAPAPMVTGAGYSLPVSGALIGASLVISMFSLFRH
ncbi:hypothetical protein ACLB2K_059747 [Fragaria x ananassa]